MKEYHPIYIILKYVHTVLVRRDNQILPNITITYSYEVNMDVSAKGYSDVTCHYANYVTYG